MADLADRLEVVRVVCAALSLTHDVIDFSGWRDAIHAFAWLAEVAISLENRVSQSPPWPTTSPLPALLALAPVDGAIGMRFAVPMRGSRLATTHGRLAWARWLDRHIEPLADRSIDIYILIDGTNLVHEDAQDPSKRKEGRYDDS